MGVDSVEVSMGVSDIEARHSLARSAKEMFGLARVTDTANSYWFPISMELSLPWNYLCLGFTCWP